MVRREEVAGLLEVPVALSALGRAGTFYFRPEAATADRVWVSGEEFMNRLAAAAEAAARRRLPSRRARFRAPTFFRSCATPCSRCRCP